MNNKFLRVAKLWLSFATLSAVIFGTMYLGLQQCIRLGANITPMECAVNMKDQLETNLSPGQAITGLPTVNIAHSLSSFVIIYDKSGHAVAGSGKLNGKFPALPEGVFKAADAKKENRISWQPQTGLRFATVILPYSSSAGDGYILSGHSLQEYEHLISLLSNILFFGWILTLAISYLFIYLITTGNKHEELSK